jgi:hypothetical protein
VEPVQGTIQTSIPHPDRNGVTARLRRPIHIESNQTSPVNVVLRLRDRPGGTLWKTHFQAPGSRQSVRRSRVGLWNHRIAIYSLLDAQSQFLAPSGQCQNGRHRRRASVSAHHLQSQAIPKILSCVATVHLALGSSSSTARVFILHSPVTSSASDKPKLSAGLEGESRIGWKTETESRSTVRQRQQSLGQFALEGLR